MPPCRTRWTALVALVWLAGPALAQAQTARIDVDPGRTFQSIDGFGVNFNGTYFRDSQKPAIDLLVDDLGATLFRLDPYGLSDWEARNDDGDPAHMNWVYYDDRYSSPMFEASWAAGRHLNAKGIRPFLTVSGLTPSWMNDDSAPPPVHDVCGAYERTEDLRFPPPHHLSPPMYEEFAEMVVSMALYARRRAGVDFEYFSPLNEVDCYAHGEGPRVDPGEAPAVLATVVRRLRREGLGNLKLVAIDPSGAADYESPLLADETVMRQLAVVSLHSYGPSERVVAPRVEHVRASRHPGTRIWLTEYGALEGGFDGSSPHDEWNVNSILATRRALVALNHGAQAALHWDAFDNYHEHDQAMTYYGLLRNDSHRYSPKKRYFAAKQLYRFVRPGSRRIAARTGADGLTVSAFRDAAAGSIVVVGVKEAGPDRVRVVLPEAEAPVSWVLHATTATLDCADLGLVPVHGGAAELELPGSAVFTLVGTASR
jgi:O-glycosyl hydrolase